MGLLGSVAFTAGVFALGIAGVRRAARPRSGAQLAAQFAHSLIPIALAYTVAHYFSLLVFQGQGLVRLASDPLGQGGDLFGTAGVAINYTALSPTTIWYVQAIALVVGHIGGLVLAHDRSLVVFSGTAVAIRSQYWMLAMMIGYTGLGLWILSGGGV